MENISINKLTSHYITCIDDGSSNKQINNNDLLEKYGGTKNCIYKD